MFCQKCGSKLSENTKFCVSCGTPLIQSDNGDAPSQTPNETVPAGSVEQLTQKLSLSPNLLGVCVGMTLVFLYYFIHYLGPWDLGLLTFLSYLLAPALFVGLILTKEKNKWQHVLFIAPFALRGFTSLINLLRGLSYMSLQGLLTNLIHIVLAVLFILTVLDKFDGKKVMLIISGGAAVIIGIMALRSGFLSGLVQILYFTSVLVLILELDIAPNTPAPGSETNLPGE